MCVHPFRTAVAFHRLFLEFGPRAHDPLLFQIWIHVPDPNSVARTEPILPVPQVLYANRAFAHIKMEAYGEHTEQTCE